MEYFGSKATSGLCQALIALMPPHSVYIESHLGGGALMKRKPTGVRFIGIDRDAQALEAFACDYPVELVHDVVIKLDRSLRLGTRIVLVGCVDVLVAENLAHALVLTRLGIEKQLGRPMAELVRSDPNATMVECVLLYLTT